MNPAPPIEQPQARTTGPGFSIDAPGAHANWIPSAIYLATSWSWCIGMFLPVLLIRDYGLWGWIVFAVPNVVGAGAMGWVLRRRTTSRHIVLAHAGACRWFSIVTFAFHIAFVGCILAPFMTPKIGTYLLLLVAFGAIYLAGEWRARADLVSSILVYALSCAMLIAYVSMVRSNQNLAPQLYLGDPRKAALLAPVCIFGFLLCPYLDITFHAARQALPVAAARRAFSVGFGVLFLLMIVFSAIYAQPLAQALKHGHTLPAIAVMAIGLHMIGQIAFTMAAHARYHSPEKLRFIVLSFLTSFVVIFIAYNVYGFTKLAGDEMVYRMFMGFYGLAFPAYVWLCMIPGRGRLKPTRWQLTVFAGAVLIALPMFWMGFILQRLTWLLPGVGMVLLARVFVRSRRLN
ncbi:MAG: hypothetical protein H7Z14_19065 [Anaerolineae bacterium]|nr:hypothetical protein [Phycisphaerae bacterium]